MGLANNEKKKEVCREVYWEDLSIVDFGGGDHSCKGLQRLLKRQDIDEEIGPHKWRLSGWSHQTSQMTDDKKEREGSEVCKIKYEAL